jgi:hypothetical protein
MPGQHSRLVECQDRGPRCGPKRGSPRQASRMCECDSVRPKCRDDAGGQGQTFRHWLKSNVGSLAARAGSAQRARRVVALRVGRYGRGRGAVRDGGSGQGTGDAEKTARTLFLGGQKKCERGVGGAHRLSRGRDGLAYASVWHRGAISGAMSSTLVGGIPAAQCKQGATHRNVGAVE